MRAQEFISEKWSRKYKRSIDCSNPKGFSQRAHCAGRKLKEFAPSPGYEPEPEDDVPQWLIRWANLWWNQADPERQQYVADQLATGGWIIRQIDDDTVEINHREYGLTYRISDDQFDPDLIEQQLDELMFMGSQCTKDCSGHRAGYEWSARKGNRTANSWSQSFNNGAAIRNAGR